MSESLYEFYDRQRKLLEAMNKEIELKGIAHPKMSTTKNYLRLAMTNFNYLAAQARGYSISAKRFKER